VRKSARVTERTDYEKLHLKGREPSDDFVFLNITLQEVNEKITKEEEEQATTQELEQMFKLVDLEAINNIHETFYY